MDKRTPLQKHLDDTFGMPLYYCEQCLCAVEVTPIENDEPLIERKYCKEHGCDPKAGIIAPRKAIAVGEGGASMSTKGKIMLMRLKAFLTNRSGVKCGG